MENKKELVYITTQKEKSGTECGKMEKE